MNFDALLNRDAALSQRLRIAEQPGPLRTLAVILGHSGDSWFWLIGLLLLVWLGSPIWKIKAVVLLLSILLTAVVVLSLKFAIRRRRPEGEWGQMYRKTDPHSFPSGHAARGVMLGVVALGLGPGWLALTLLAWGPLVGMARVAMGVHYVSDVLAGWLVGVMMGAVCLKLAAPYL